MPSAPPPVWVVPPGEQVPPDHALLPDDWTARAGFGLPASPWDLSARRWACTGEVTDPGGARAAIEALTRGVALSITVTLTGDDRRRFEEDLARTGSLVTDRSGDASGLAPEHIALLGGLAAGLSVTAAAASANLSRRTANRRLAEARVRLGVSTTAEAVTRWGDRTRPEAQRDA
jgi:hypothetical protein